MSEDRASFMDRLWLRAADARQYTAVRVGLALVSLINLVDLWPHRHALFSDAGMIDQQTVIGQSAVPYFSLFELIESPAAVSGYLVFSGFCMLLLLAGILPRAAAFAVFIWHLSFINRAPLGITGADWVLQVFSFLVLVSPMGHRLWPKRGAAPAPPVYGLTLMRLQTLVIYVQTVLYRWGSDHWENGDFLSYFLLSLHSRFPGEWVIQAEPVLKLLTWVTSPLELAIPILLWVRRTRWIGFGLGLVLHGGIAIVAHDLLVFLLVMVMTWLPFLRPQDFDRFSRSGRLRP